jgi:hypothetical protein
MLATLGAGGLGEVSRAIRSLPSNSLSLAAGWPGWAVWKVLHSVFFRPQKWYTKGFLGCKTVFFRVIWRTSGVLGAG